jgi:Aromatic-ring-opening dioxygenase LigAB, LigA subunit
MASKLTDFLISFGDDPNLVRDFEQNPQAVMHKAGLSPDEQRMILNRDVKGIRAHLHADPDLRQAMGIPASQSFPIPIFVFPPTP